MFVGFSQWLTLGNWKPVLRCSQSAQVAHLKSDCLLQAIYDALKTEEEVE